MKKLMMTMFFLAAVVFASSAAGDSDKAISFDKLPKMAQEFIQTHFKGVNVVKCQIEMPWTQYDVRMANGYDLEFDRSGKWIEIDKDRGGITQTLLGLLPQQAYNYLNTNYSGVQVEKIERRKNGFKATLDTKPEETKIHFNKDGKFMSKKID